MGQGNGKKRPRVLTGMQPTAVVHLGNFLGAIRTWVALQEDCDCLFFLPDMHAITVPQDPNELRTNTLAGVAAYLACGIDPDRSAIFVQSQVWGHAELAWTLGCHTPIGQLERMTQFKDKAARPGAFIGAGLLYYPVLMAADILLYDADRVPVGDDQRQHLELTRDLAERFNAIHGPVLTMPEPYVAGNCSRVMSLQNPAVKMSKSDGNGLATVFLTDSDEQIRKKFRAAVTDSKKEIRHRGDGSGVANLLEIFSALAGLPVADVEKRHETSSYGAFKDELADLAIAVLAPIRKKFFELQKNPDHLLQVLERGREMAQPIASATVGRINRAVGFLELSKGGETKL
ncbi:MAG: tryptophan--tRNA ligase [Puniceicoccales bacterium]|jgi:tryptophanyl-tRNA synthetase|nr:tryptophan--tRNA ligase [Puniceicoccales bacterium]